jgi:hypothetical protein
MVDTSLAANNCYATRAPSRQRKDAFLCFWLLCYVFADEEVQGLLASKWHGMGLMVQHNKAVYEDAKKDEAERLAALKVQTANDMVSYAGGMLASVHVTLLGRWILSYNNVQSNVPSAQEFTCGV